MSRVIAVECEPSPFRPFDYRYDGSCDRISLFGNHNFHSYYFRGTKEIWEILVSSDIKELIDEGYSYEESVHAVFANARLIHSKEKLDDRDMLEIADLSYMFSDSKELSIRLYAFCQVLNIFFGGSWEATYFRGTTPGDWILAVYDEDVYDEAALRNLEIEYWNLGSEWDVLIDGSSRATEFYSHFTSDEEVTQEICKAYGYDEVTLVHDMSNVQLPVYAVV